MFTNKQTQLFSTPSTSNVVQGKNRFVQAALQKSVETNSGNGALKYESTLDVFVDQFGRVGSYRTPRTFADIEKDSELLWAENKLDAIKFIHYLRIIPRKVQLLSGETTNEPQKGAELKFESIMRMIWLSQKDPKAFWKNIGLFVSVGSWHDIFTMLQYDLVYNGWNGRKLDWTSMGSLILTALENPNTVNLVKKYLPQVKARSACKTVESQANCMVAKWICSLLFGTKESSLNYKRYRQLKASGSAHEWQQLISQRKFDKIDFNSIHGRALTKLVKGKFLENQGLKDKYTAWVAAPTTELKFTGFVHELFEGLPTSLSGLEKHRQDTINKQFETLVEKAKSEFKDNSCRFIVARDISRSMTSQAVGLKMSSFDVAKALALYFSEFLTGEFADSYMCFASEVKMQKWTGSTPLEKWYNDRTLPFGGTNFQGTIDLMVNLKSKGIPEADFPTGIISISDGDFNPAQAGKTNVEAAKIKLTNGGFSKEFVEKFTIVLWNIPNGYYGRGHAQFESKANDKGIYYFSGLSGSVISFISGHEVLTARQVFDKAMGQEVLDLISI
jgi:hypothetical protein